ncbi:MAG: hypothetical protein ABJN24_11795 [Hyphomicrobiales bacterium]
MTKSIIIMTGLMFLLASCVPEASQDSDAGNTTEKIDSSKIIYENETPLSGQETIKLHEVKIVGNFHDTLTVDFTYTYDHDIPAEEVRLFVTPNHEYWRARYVTIDKGTHTARAIINLSNKKMHTHGKAETHSTELFFRFGHYVVSQVTGKTKFKGNFWDQTVNFRKTWSPK